MDIDWSPKHSNDTFLKFGFNVKKWFVVWIEFEYNGIMDWISYKFI